jgi:hypothetical protein
MDYPDSIFNVLNRCEAHYQNDLLGQVLGGDGLQEVQQLRAKMFPRGSLLPISSN